jgi:glutamate-1-semialdehyde 2,1-aminomutase
MATPQPTGNLDVDTALKLAEGRYTAAHPRSRAQIERAARSMPGGNTRTILFFQPFPLVVKRSEGCRIFDIDGNDYVDFLGEYTAGLFGHSDPTIKAAILAALDTGWVHGGHIESETVLAEAVCARFPSIERVRFTNSGTEANLMAITTARLHTQRSKVMVMRGGYHGGVLLFKTGTIPQNAPYPYVLGAYNDIDATVKKIEANAADLACVLIEPVQGSAGCIPAEPAFLQALRDACTQHGIVLIFDEVMTSRLAPGGLQEQHGVIPDMTTLGKYVGGGCSFGAFGGRAGIMALYDPYRSDAIAHAGTFNNNAMTMAAGVAAMTQVYTPARAEALNTMGDGLRARLNGEAAKRGLPVQVTGLGSMMNVHFRGGQIRNSDDAAASSDTARGLFHIEMLERGFHCARRGMINLSLPMGKPEIDGLVTAFADFLDAHTRVIRSLPHQA